MNPLFKILTFPLRAFQGFNLNFPSVGGLLGTMMPRSRFAYGKAVDPMLSAPVMACINWVIRNFPEAPIVVRKRDEEGVGTIDLKHLAP